MGGGGLIGLILKIHQDGCLNENKQLKGLFVGVYVPERVRGIQSTVFFTTYSRLSANISAASTGRQSGRHHIVGFCFADASVNRAEQTVDIAAAVSLL